jgi:2-dehydropantoate 2-reductase
MKILVWGAGAIGGTIGVYLHRGEHDVVLVDRDEKHVERIRQDGLSLIGGVELCERVPAVTPEEVSGDYDAVLLCVKSQDTLSAIEGVAQHLGSTGYVVGVQNGVSDQEIATVVGADRVIEVCINNFHADYIEPGVINYSKNGRLVLGEPDGRRTPRLEQMRASLNDFSALATDNIWGYKWSKASWAAMITATALSNETMSGAIGNAEYQEVYAGLISEVLAVALAAGIKPEPFPGFEPLVFMPGWNLADARASLNRTSAHLRPFPKQHSGPWRDLAVRKRRTEVDAQFVPIHELAANHGVATPLSMLLLRLIHEVEEGSLAQGFAGLDRLMGLVNSTRVTTAGE